MGTDESTPQLAESLTAYILSLFLAHEERVRNLLDEHERRTFTSCCEISTGLHDYITREISRVVKALWEYRPRPKVRHDSPHLSVAFESTYEHPVARRNRRLAQKRSSAA